MYSATCLKSFLFNSFRRAHLQTGTVF